MRLMSVTRTERGDVVVLTLDRPPVNALDVQTLDELSDHLDACGDVGAVVLTGAGRTFSAGADLVAVLGAQDDEIDAGIDALTRCFRTLFLVPRPVVAAVNGAALAGGAVLACACDYRVAGERGPIGVIELAAGVPFPAWALEVVRYGVAHARFQEVVYLAGGYSPDEARSVGLVDETTNGDVVDRAVEVAERLAAIPRESYRITKATMRSATAREADRLTLETQDEVKASWRSDEVKAAIRAQLERLAKR